MYSVCVKSKRDYLDAKQAFKDHAEFKKVWDESQNEINIKLIDVNDFPIERLNCINNQILVILDNGEIVVIPRGTYGTRVINYLGFKAAKAKYYSVLPTKRIGSKQLVDIYKTQNL